MPLVSRCSRQIPNWDWRMDKRISKRATTPQWHVNFFKCSVEKELKRNPMRRVLTPWQRASSREEYEISGWRARMAGELMRPTTAQIYLILDRRWRRSVSVAMGRFYKGTCGLESNQRSRMYTFSVGVKQLPQRGRRMSGRSASPMVVVVVSNVPDGGGGG